MILFACEFFVFINKNVLTRQEIESGWTSTNRARLAWSYYILLVAVVLIFMNIGLTYVMVRMRRRSSANFLDRKSLGKFNRRHLADQSATQFHPASSLSVQAAASSPQLVSSSSIVVDVDGGCRLPTSIVDYRQILGESAPSRSSRETEQTNTDDTDIRYSRRLKRLIDFIY